MAAEGKPMVRLTPRSTTRKAAAVGEQVSPNCEFSEASAVSMISLAAAAILSAPAATATVPAGAAPHSAGAALG